MATIEDLKLALQPKSKDKTEEGSSTGDGLGAEEPIERPQKIKKSEIAVAKKNKKAGLTVGSGEDEVVSDGADNAAWESGSVSGADDDAEDGWESGSIGGEVHSASDDDGDASPDGDSSSEDEDSDREEDTVKKPAGKLKSTVPKAASLKAKPKASASASTFLPSLSVGFIRGDSDSEWSDSEDKTEDVRKNRRGQRARRA